MSLIERLLRSLAVQEGLPAPAIERRVEIVMEVIAAREGTAGSRPASTRGPAPDLLSALLALRGGRPGLRQAAFRAALEFALGSGTLPLTQHLALRTVSDALGLPKENLASAFLARTGSALPGPWDPSDARAWRLRASSSRGADPWDDAGPCPAPPKARAPTTPLDRIARIKALALLGLEENADLDAIRKAYKRVSKVHHPDRYADQGPEASQEATRTFQRIREAYEALVPEDRR